MALYTLRENRRYFLVIFEFVFTQMWYKNWFFEFQGHADDSPSFFSQSGSGTIPQPCIAHHTAKELGLLWSGTILSLCLFLVCLSKNIIELLIHAEWHYELLRNSADFQGTLFIFLLFSPPTPRFVFSHGCASIWKAFGTLHGNYEKEHHHLWRTISCPVWNKHGYCWTYCMKRKCMEQEDL